MNSQPQYILVEPTNKMLNEASVQLQPSEITSPKTQDIIKGMLRLAAGKGHSKEDSRQMVGLAAPQLGIHKCIICIDVTADGAHKTQHMQVVINPKIVFRSKQMIAGREGCWSCGNICGNVERARDITLEGVDSTGLPVHLTLSGFVARIAQHEVDHLLGIRFPDRIPISSPERLHWVEPAEFDNYRTNWQHWPILCKRQTWEAMKSGTIA